MRSGLTEREAAEIVVTGLKQLMQKDWLDDFEQMMAAMIVEDALRQTQEMSREAAVAWLKKNMIMRSYSK